MFWKAAISIMLLAAGAGGMAALVKSKPQPAPLEIRKKVWPVAVIAVEPRSLSPSLTLYARVDSPRVSTLTAAVSADVLLVDVLDGQHVNSAELLIRLDDRDTQLEIAQHAANVAEIEAELAQELASNENDKRALALERRLLALIRRDVERAEKLATREVGSASRLDEARQAEARQMLAVDNRRLSIAQHESRRQMLTARLERAQAMLEQERLDAERTHVRAPFSGPVAEVFVSPGDRVRAGDRLLSMYDDRRLEFRAQIPTRYLAELRAGLARGTPIEAVASVDGRTVSAVLERMGAAVERGSGGSDALFRIERGEADTLELGRTVRLTVSLPASEDVVAIPPEALYGTDRVYLLDGDRMRSVKVNRVGEYAPADGSRQLLVRADALKSGQTLIVTHLPNAVDGLQVRVAAEDAGGSGS